MKFTYLITGILNVLIFQQVYSQQSRVESGREALYVFMDCNDHNCDYDHFRREIPWVIWVRDRQDCDLHLLITSEQTSGGGYQFTLDYLGRRSYDGIEKSLVTITDPNFTDTEIRQQMTESISIGLVQFVENRPQIASRLKVVFVEDTEEKLENEWNDPWNLWVFRLGIEGSMEGESQEKSFSLESYSSASRITEDLKLIFELDLEYDREEFDDIEEGETFTNISKDYSLEALSVWSLDPHWSLGGMAELNKSTFLNRDLAFFGGPAIEYNIFPYNESTTKSLTLRYTLEYVAYDYELETVEGRLNESLGRHSLQLSAAIQQPWGEIFGFVEGIQYFNDFSNHRINTYLNLEYRLFRGFNVDLFFSFSRIKDQFYLPAIGLTPEEILVRRRQRETDHRFDIGLGFSYLFGSKYANIVNTRID